MLAVRVGPTFPDARKHFQKALTDWETTIERVADLFVRIRTTNQSELASTVHFVAHELGSQAGEKPSEEQVVEQQSSFRQTLEISIRVVVLVVFVVVASSHISPSNSLADIESL